MRVKLFVRFDRSWPKIRLGRLMWETGPVGDGKNTSNKVALALRPTLFEFRREWDGWRVVLIGIEAHFQRSFGGIFA